MAAPVKRDFDLVRGVSKVLRYAVTRNGVALDLANFTGANRRGSIKRTRQSTTVDAVFEFSEETPPGTDGILLATITATESAKLECDSEYDIELERDGDPLVVHPVGTGSIKVKHTTNEDPPP